jgi:hypothetical protein
VRIAWTEYLKETANGLEGREQRFNCIGIREETVLVRISGRHYSTPKWDVPITELNRLQLTHIKIGGVPSPRRAFGGVADV